MSSIILSNNYFYRTSMSNDGHDGAKHNKKNAFVYMRQDTRQDDDDLTSAPTPLPQHREIFGQY